MDFSPGIYKGIIGYRIAIYGFYYTCSVLLPGFRGPLFEIPPARPAKEKEAHRASFSLFDMLQCMVNKKSVSGFEYKNKGVQTPFETFLKYTDEKEKSSAVLGNVLGNLLKKGRSVLGSGTGNGEYLELALAKSSTATDISLTLVEPSQDLVKILSSRVKSWPQQVEIVHSSFEEFSTESRYDIALASHVVYHMPRATWPDALSKMASLLRSGGRLIIVARGSDDPYAFKMKFKPRLFDSFVKAISADDIVEVLPDTLRGKANRYMARSHLKVPIDTSVEDTQTIIEFYLNKKWEELPRDIQAEALSFIKERRGIFEQLDEIVVVEKA